jgi:REP element-mobilizing transposase RayT
MCYRVSFIYFSNAILYYKYFILFKHKYNKDHLFYVDRSCLINYISQVSNEFQLFILNHILNIISIMFIKTNFIE